MEVVRFGSLEVWKFGVNPLILQLITGMDMFRGCGMSVGVMGLKTFAMAGWRT